jgi:hypothetical protein
MSRINDINKVLPVKAGTTIYAKNQDISGLGEGQVAVFDGSTNKSVDATTSNLDKIRDFYVAIGVGTPTGGVIPDIRKSPGLAIQSKNISGYTFQSYSQGRNKILKINPGTQANCDKAFMLKFQFENGQIYRSIGFNQYTKIYNVKTGCCDDCFTCFSGDTNEVTSLMVQSINADTDKLLTAKAVMTAATLITDVAAGGVLSKNYSANEVITVYADLLVLAKFNRTVDTVAERFYSYLTVEVSAIAEASFNGINLNYFLTRQTDVKVALADGFSCDKDVTITQELAYEMGSGYDLYQREYHAGGHQGSAYRVSSITGLQKNDTVALVEKSLKYDLVDLFYDLKFYSLTQEYTPNRQSVTVAFPTANTAARNSFIAIIDAIVAGQGLDPLADDVTASTDGASGVEAAPSSTILDGISE